MAAPATHASDGPPTAKGDDDSFPVVVVLDNDVDVVALYGNTSVVVLYGDIVVVVLLGDALEVADGMLVVGCWGGEADADEDADMVNVEVAVSSLDLRKAH